MEPFGSPRDPAWGSASNSNQVECPAPGSPSLVRLPDGKDLVKKSLVITKFIADFRVIDVQLQAFRKPRGVKPGARRLVAFR